MNWLSMLGLEAWVMRCRAMVMEGAIALEDRADLARLEWADQKQRLQKALVLAVALAGLTVVALILVSVAVIVQFWDTPHRILTAWLVGGAWLLVWAIVLALLLSTLRLASNAFALTRHELLQDWRHLKEKL